MAIDSIKKSDSSATLEFETQRLKRQALDEQRERELKKVDDSYREQVEQTGEQRAQALEKISLSAAEDITRARREAESKNAAAQQYADQQIRNFQQDTQRMTDEARRQFQAKAQSLVDAKRDMEMQREQILKQHSDTVRTMSKEQAERAHDTKTKYDRDFESLHQNAQKQTMNLIAQNNDDLRRIADEFAQRKRQAQQDGSFQLAGLQDQHRRQQLELGNIMHMERDLENQKLQGEQNSFLQRYGVMKAEHDGNLENLNRLNHQKLQEIKKSGDLKINQTQDYYQHATGVALRENEAKLSLTKTKSQELINQMDEQFKNEKHHAELRHKQEMKGIQKESDDNKSAMLQQTNDEKSKMETAYLKQSQTIRDKRLATLKGLQDQMHNEIKSTMDRSKAQLDALKQKDSIKVASHDSKVADPFYRIHDLGVVMVEDEAGFRFNIQVPEHEKDNVRIVQAPHGITVSGNRRLEDRMNLSPGHSVSTNSYQSYAETFPVAGKLNFGKMTRTYESGVLRVFVPKT